MKPDCARSDNHVEAGASFLPLLGKRAKASVLLAFPR